MSADIALCCNGLVPACGLPVGAQSQRLYGLYLGLRAHGIKAHIITPASTVRVQLERWGGSAIRIPAYWRIIGDEAYSRVLCNEYRAVLFSNWASLGTFRKTEKVKVIYDFFSASMVEHAFISSPEELAEKRHRKIALLKMADHFIANGRYRADYATDFLRQAGIGEGNASVVSVPIAMPWLGLSLKDPPRDLFVGGYQQAWSKSLTIRTLGHLANELGRNVHIFGYNQNPNRKGPPQMALADGGSAIVNHRSGPLERFNDVNRRCALTLDVFEANEERRLSYSTRAINALANGCPVMHMSFTEIGEMIAESGCGLVLDTFSLAGIESALKDWFVAPERQQACREATRVFWERHIDPAVQAEPLAALLT